MNLKIDTEPTAGPLRVVIGRRWPWVVKTMDTAGNVVRASSLPCHSSADKTFKEAVNCVHFKYERRSAAAKMNKKFLADTYLAAAAPELYAALSVIKYNIGIRSYLEKKDPKALEQIEAALRKADGGGL